MQCWNNSRGNQQSSHFSAGGWAEDRKPFVPPWRSVGRLCSEPWATEALTGKRHAAACPRSRKLLAISAQPFSCGVLIYQLAAVLQRSCHQWWIKQGKSILSCHVKREQIQYVLKADGWRQGLCLNAPAFLRGEVGPARWAGEPFVFGITGVLLPVVHCSPWMNVTFCCPTRRQGNENVE